MQIPNKSGLLTSLLLISALIFSLALAELGLRVTDFSYYWSLARYPDPITGWSAKPGTTGWQRLEGDAYVEINGDGWRDVVHTIKPEPGIFRIAFIGDSFTEAVQIPLEQSYWRLLEGMLPNCPTPGVQKKIEILGFAVSGYSTAQEMLVLENKVWKYQPDLIVLAFFSGNDLIENSQVLGGDAMRPVFTLEGGELKQNMNFLQSAEYQTTKSWLGRVKWSLITNSRLVQAITLAMHRLQIASKVAKHDETAISNIKDEPGVDVRVYSPPTTKEWQSSWKTTEAILERMHLEVAEHQAKFLVITLTTGAQVHPNQAFREQFKKQLNIPNLFYADERIRQIGNRVGFPVLNLAKDFQQFATNTGIWLHGFKNSGKGVGHWNQNGHRLAAERIASYLCNNSELFVK
ncbi:MAG: SGNH/GDSL hydrolase family protein [Magnetococcales bacterium]|nr:SGNH/GDSL hydrolase family protein [Magnetococcales bacterium]